MRKLSLKPPERTAALQAVWDEQGSADLGPCGESASKCEKYFQSSRRCWYIKSCCLDSLQAVFLISTGVCVITWVCRTERRSNGFVFWFFLFFCLFLRLLLLSLINFCLFSFRLILVLLFGLLLAPCVIYFLHFNLHLPHFWLFFFFHLFFFFFCVRFCNCQVVPHLLFKLFTPFVFTLSLSLLFCSCWV